MQLKLNTLNVWVANVDELSARQAIKVKIFTMYNVHNVFTFTTEYVDRRHHIVSAICVHNEKIGFRICIWGRKMILGMLHLHATSFPVHYAKLPTTIFLHPDLNLNVGNDIMCLSEFMPQKKKSYFCKTFRENYHWQNAHTREIAHKKLFSLIRPETGSHTYIIISYAHYIKVKCLKMSD